MLRSEASFPTTGPEESRSAEPRSPLPNSVTRQTYSAAEPFYRETHVVIQENNSRGAYHQGDRRVLADRQPIHSFMHQLLSTHYRAALRWAPVRGQDSRVLTHPGGGAKQHMDHQQAQYSNRDVL